MDETEELPGNARKNKLLGLELPGNSDTVKRSRRKQEIVASKRKVSGRIVKKKESLGARFAQTFLGGDAQNVGEYVVRDVLVPALKSMMSDMVTGGIEMLLFGDRQTNRGSSRGNKKIVSYSNFFQDAARPDSISRRRGPRRDKLDDIYVDSRRDADITLEQLDNIMEEFGVVTVADLLTTLELESDFTDTKIGWTNITAAKVTRTPDGYKINMPRPKNLD